MGNRRNSCPKQREIIDIGNFDIEDRSNYDGTETCRCLNKFERRWFRENAVAVLRTSKSLYGGTFVIPYIDRDGKRYWLTSYRMLERNRKLIEKYGEDVKL